MGSLWSDQCSGVHWEEIRSLGPKEQTEQQMRFDSACCSHEIVVRSERLVTAGLVYLLNIHQASLFVLVSKCECLFLAL